MNQKIRIVIARLKKQRAEVERAIKALEIFQGGGDGRPPGRPKGAGVLSLEERFTKFVKRGGPDDCWLWEGSTSKWKDGEGNSTKDGHGRIWDGKSVISAHHAAYILEHGAPPPKGTYLRRTCKNRLCVNPQHFELLETKKKVIEE